ncbi:chemical-damaging agent resistance protein C [Nocardioides sp. Root190]|uniref:TerD family protein n=1 Tax=Nocardioides sp. Root190 TaxID=1736488 RepID=UPI0006FBDC11|nr:TerD family protein [Nocardioides sp. Root190]KRB75813.1 chemical-damaging agent resistance protein C [Nocardioides sp. Root190]
MAVSLGKGGNVSLTKEASGGLTAVTVALGWDERTTSGADFDLDASALILGENGRVLSDQHFVFYGNLTYPPGTHLEDALVGHTGDVTDGGVEGDDESINVNLAALGSEMARVVFPVSIHDADARGQNFGQVQNAYIRIVNSSDNRELVRYDLTEDYSTETALVFGELYRNGDEWKFRAVGQGYASGLAGIVRDFGVNVS